MHVLLLVHEELESEEEMAMNVQELLDELSDSDPKARVVLEGCCKHCLGDIESVETHEDGTVELIFEH